MAITTTSSPVPWSCLVRAGGLTVSSGEERTSATTDGWRTLCKDGKRMCVNRTGSSVEENGPESSPPANPNLLSTFYYTRTTLFFLVPKPTYAPQPTLHVPTFFYTAYWPTWISLQSHQPYSVHCSQTYPPWLFSADFLQMVMFHILIFICSNISKCLRGALKPLS